MGEQYPALRVQQSLQRSVHFPGAVVRRSSTPAKFAPAVGRRVHGLQGAEVNSAHSPFQWAEPSSAPRTWETAREEQTRTRSGFSRSAKSKKYRNSFRYAFLATLREPPYGLRPPSGSAVAHGGNHASSYNGGNPRNGLAPQDRAASLATTRRRSLCGHRFRTRALGTRATQWLTATRCFTVKRQGEAALRQFIQF